MALTRWVGRAIGLDVHRDFCEVAICENGKVRSAGRVASTPEALGMFADSLSPTDRVVLEVTGSCWEVARILKPCVDRVVVVSPDGTGIAAARAKTDWRSPPAPRNARRVPAGSGAPTTPYVTPSARSPLGAIGWYRF